jgi:hypothetical protein
MKDYKEENKESIQRHNREKYLREKRMWLGSCKNITREISESAEFLALSILKIEGFNDVIKVTPNMAFDYFGKKRGKICCIDVTTSLRKPIRFQQVRMALYFGMSLYILFIKPDLAKYRLVKMPRQYLQKGTRYKSMNVHSLVNFEDMKTEVIRLDIDSSLLGLWYEDWLKAQKAVIRAYGYHLKDVIVRPSGDKLPWLDQDESKREHYHVWHHILTPRQLTDIEKLKLQFLLGSDTGRCWINYLRITKRHSPHWDKLFGYVAWRSPQDPRCKRCRLLILLEELKEGEKSGEKTGEKKP